jgi:hypothetical protein
LNTAAVAGSARLARWSSRLGSLSAVSICLLLIFLALLGIENEIRYQSCVSRIDQQALVAATQNPKSLAPVELKCHRVPFT